MATFDAAIDTVLKHEGGYVNDSRDPGGETNFGISKRAFPHVDIKRLTRHDAVEIYRRHYWSAALARLRDQAVATKVFDFMVNFGHERATKIFQHAINLLAGHDRPVAVDGRLGPKTVDRANELDQARLLRAIEDGAADRYRAIVKAHPERAKFLKGWLERAYDRPQPLAPPRARSATLTR